MFTGLIETVGRIRTTVPIASGVRLEVDASFASDLLLGESIAVNGVCLTVVAHDGNGFEAEVGPETIRRTTLGGLRPGTAVNLERAMRADARLGGHLVQGHVDDVGTLTALRDQGEARWITIEYPGSLAAGLVPQGSVAVDGISLTIASLREQAFDVMIVPFTWAHTNLSSAQAGDRVNLECDLVGKYVARAVAVHLAGRVPPVVSDRPRTA